MNENETPKSSEELASDLAQLRKTYEKIKVTFVNVDEAWKTAKKKATEAYQVFAELNAQSSRLGNELADLKYTCLLYTSDAADERSSVDLGGRRIIKKK